MSEHLVGRPVSKDTYRRYGCRCDGCRAAATLAGHGERRARNGALLKVQSRCQSKATTWVRANCPALWAQFLAESYDELGIERRKPGQRRSDSSAPVPGSDE